ncbi:hypothetical protein SDC9_103525 [bioreactor metagenome]|uniref:Uncharacterized protein n=1 Tax=bioreactor metagenome TaxID=1076179 RepID=A0A645AWN4_9ZZZZ
MGVSSLSKLIFSKLAHHGGLIHVEIAGNLPGGGVLLFCPAQQADLGVLNSLGQVGGFLLPLGLRSVFSPPVGGGKAGTLVSDPGYVADLQLLVGTHDHHALHHVAQFADVALPLVFLQPLDHLGGKGLLLVVFAVKEIEKKQAQGQDVLPPLPQGRHGDGNHVEPVIKILPEGSRVRHFGQVSIGGGDKAHVDALGLDAPHPGDLFGFQHPQQLHLNGQGNLPDFVEKDRPAVGGLQQTDFPGG